MVSIPTSNISTSHLDVQLEKTKQDASLTLTKQILLFLEYTHTHKFKLNILVWCRYIGCRDEDHQSQLCFTI